MSSCDLIAGSLHILKDAVVKPQHDVYSFGMNTFLQKQGYTLIKPLKQDASTRRYFRVEKNAHTAILMQEIPDSPDMKSFIEIAGWLRAIGLKAPEIYETALDEGFMLLEDLGDIVFKKAQDQSTLYPLAANVLDHIATQNCPLNLPSYHESSIHKGHRRIIDWYLPLARGAKNEDGMIEEYQSVWKSIEENLPPCPQAFVHVDYHAENLMWLPEEEGLKRCGILDFQSAMIGPAPYDLANLLEDARTDVPIDLQQQILARYDEAFRLHYRVLATQFHCRVIGQFIKMALLNDNTNYLQHIPRLEGYLRKALNEPVLAPLKAFFESLKLDFSKPYAFNGGRSKELISSTAF